MNTELVLDDGQTCEIAYLKRGVGKDTDDVLVIVHGLGNWSKVLDVSLAASIENEAKERGESIQIFCIDMPGHGDSDKKLENFSTDVVVEVIDKFTEKMGFDTVHLYGESTGGSACIKFARKYPQKTKTLTLQGPPIDGEDWGWMKRVHRPALSPRNAMKYFEWQEYTLPGKITGFIIEFVARFTNTAADLETRHKIFKKIEGMKKAFVESRNKISLVAAMDYMYDVANLDLKDVLTAIGNRGTPVFLVDGDNPEHKGVDTLDRIKELIPYAETLRIEGQGHLATMLGSEKIAEQLLNFIKNGSTR